MTTDRLSLYNYAMVAIGERPIDSLDEDSESRRLCDEIYTRGKGLQNACLEQGLWNFAMRAVKIDKSDSVTPEFGWQNAFDIPSDFVRLNQISSDPSFVVPLNTYEFEGDYIYTNIDPLYLRFVSDDSDWGGDFSKWPETFTLWVGHWMGLQLAPRLLNARSLEGMINHNRKLLRDAQSKDAQMEPTRFPPMSSWNRARFGGRRGQGRDRGSRSALIG